MSANRASFIGIAQSNRDDLPESGSAASASHPPARAALWQSGSVAFFETVPETAHGADFYSTAVELLAQAVYIDFDGVGADFLAPFAHMVDQPLLADHPAGASQQDLQQAHFMRRQVQKLALECCRPAHLVISQITVAQQAGSAHLTAAGERPHPGFELSQRERFG